MQMIPSTQILLTYFILCPFINNSGGICSSLWVAVFRINASVLFKSQFNVYHKLGPSVPGAKMITNSVASRHILRCNHQGAIISNFEAIQVSFTILRERITHIQHLNDN